MVKSKGTEVVFLPKKPVVGIISAGDRYNYGDVLYAVVLKEYIRKFEPQIFQKYDIEHYGIISSDLRKVGGLETLPIKALYEKDFAENSLIVVAGGQVIGANIEVLFKFLKTNKIRLYADLIKYLALSKLGKSRRELLVKRFGCKTKFPYIISADELKSDCKVVYSNVGGFVSENETQAIKQISKADYFSVRDSQSFEENCRYRKDTILTPDAAVLMSEIFPRDQLEKEVSEQVRAVGGEYIAVQFSLSYFRQHKSEIVEVLKAFKEENKDVKIVLVPIGYAILHDDLIALKGLKAEISEAVLVENLTVKEIMYLISGASFFLGTSLHGIVTAMSFEVPYIALGGHNSSQKLDIFVKTWGCEPYNKAMPISVLQGLYKEKDLSRESLENSAKEQIKLAKRNYDNIFSLIK